MKWMLMLAGLAALAPGCYKKGNVSSPCTVIGLQSDRIAKLYQEREAPTTTAPVYWARHYLEEARYVLTGGEEGYAGATTCTSQDCKFTQYRDLKRRFQEAEERVRYIEEQRGVKFHSVPGGNSLRWVYTKDGTDVPNDAANHL